MSIIQVMHLGGQTCQNYCLDPLRISDHTSSSQYNITVWRISWLVKIHTVNLQMGQKWLGNNVPEEDRPLAMSDRWVDTNIPIPIFFLATIQLRHVFCIIMQNGPAGLLHVTGYIMYISWLHSLPCTTFPLTCQCILTLPNKLCLSFPFASMQKIPDKATEITQRKRLLQQFTISPLPNTDILFKYRLYYY